MPSKVAQKALKEKLITKKQYDTKIFLYFFYIHYSINNE